MKTLYIKIFKCFTYHFQKCMTTNHLNAYHNLHCSHAPRGNASTDALRPTVCLREKVCGEKFNAERRRKHSHGDRGNDNKNTQSNHQLCLCFAKQYNFTSNSSIFKTLYIAPLTPTFSKGGFGCSFKSSLAPLFQRGGFNALGVVSC